LRGARSFGEAIAVFDSRARDEAVGLNNEGLRALQAGEIDRAGTLFERAAARDPANPAVSLNLGTLARRRGQTARAESLYLVALRRLEPNGPADLRVSAFVNLADLDLEAENWDGAVNWLGRAGAIDSSATVVNNLGYALAMGGRGREALAVLSRGIARFPGQAALLKNAALAELKLGRAGAARDSVERALEIDPAYLPAIALRAQLSARRGDRAAVLADWKRFLAGEPDERLRKDLAAELARLGVAVP
jgi:Tfp pilus assembly protein PilF